MVHFEEGSLFQWPLLCFVLGRRHSSYFGAGLQRRRENAAALGGHLAPVKGSLVFFCWRRAPLDREWSGAGEWQPGVHVFRRHGQVPLGTSSCSRGAREDGPGDLQRFGGILEASRVGLRGLRPFAGRLVESPGVPRLRWAAYMVYIEVTAAVKDMAESIEEQRGGQLSPGRRIVDHRR